MNPTIDYETFLRRHFRSIHHWSADQTGDEVESAILAQRVALDLYHAMSGAVRRTNG